MTRLPLADRPPLEAYAPIRTSARGFRAGLPLMEAESVCCWPGHTDEAAALACLEKRLVELQRDGYKRVGKIHTRIIQREPTDRDPGFQWAELKGDTA